MLFEYRSSVSELSDIACELYLAFNGNPKRFVCQNKRMNLKRVKDSFIALRLTWIIN